VKSILTIIGTRPEAIKLAPVLSALNNHQNFKSQVCITRQHTDLLDTIFSHLKIDVNYNLDKPIPNSSLAQKTAYILEKLGNLLEEVKPDLVLVQGDTTTAFAGALAAYYAHIPVGHIEAGLRTRNLNSPWPEEGHRCLIDRLTTYFFAPTSQALNVLLSEGVPSDRAWIVGNTSIDALRLVRKASDIKQDSKPKTIVVTIHRRENHGRALKEICSAAKYIAEAYNDLRIMFILHPNPAIWGPVNEMLFGIENIELKQPLDHPTFIHHLDESIFIVSDSGGIQEEAPFLGKPVLITRDTTERPEGIQAGTAKLVGTKAETIISACQELLENPSVLASMSKVHYPFGDGYAAERIVSILESQLFETGLFNYGSKPSFIC